MNIIDIAVFLGAMFGLAAFVCRIDQVRWWTHSPGLVLMHCAMAIGCGAAAAHAWQGSTTLVDAAAVLASIAWIAVSLRDWPAVPSNALRTRTLVFPPRPATGNPRGAAK